jgi:spheroidene monooxygenase
MADRMATRSISNLFPAAASGTGTSSRSRKTRANRRFPLVALTRASIRPSKLIRFWSPRSRNLRAVEREDMRRFMIGTGEIPWLHQVTVSLWQSVEEMERFSSAHSATHGEAVRLAYQDNWFSEYCFTRFNLLAIEGDWQGLTDMTGRIVKRP